MASAEAIPPKDAARIFAQIDARLANDNAVGRILIEGEEGGSTELLAFPGRDRPKSNIYGPFNQEGSLEGLLISVGGKDDTVPLRLQDGDVIHSSCETTRSIARDLARHLFEPVRIHGTGRWMRDGNGKWTLLRFRVHGFEVLEKATLREGVTALRGVRGEGRGFWEDLADPLAELADLRRDDDEH